MTKPLREWWVGETRYKGLLVSNTDPKECWPGAKTFHVREVSPALDAAVEGLVEALTDAIKSGDGLISTSCMEYALEAYRAARGEK